jgi:hemerythrin
MAFFEWDQSLDVGVEAMNQQHRILIRLMDAIYNKNSENVGKEELLKSIYAMVDYTRQHFCEEEQYMSGLGFSGLEAHKRLHLNLLADLTRFVEDFEQGNSNNISDDFAIFLKFWLSTHIRGIDTRYGQFAEQQRQAS